MMGNNISYIEDIVFSAYDEAEKKYQQLKPVADSVDGEAQEAAYDAGFADGKREMAFKIWKMLVEIKKLEKCR